MGNLVLNTMLNLQNFYSWFLTISHIVIIYLVQSGKFFTDGRNHLEKDATQG